MKARHCDECKHATVKWYEYKGPPMFDVLTCAKKHKPRHYMPRNAMDTDYGWKRVCADFELRAELDDPGTTHSEGCWTWGPKHYGCAENRIKELEAELAAMRAKWDAE